MTTSGYLIYAPRYKSAKKGPRTCNYYGDVTRLGIGMQFHVE